MRIPHRMRRQQVIRRRIFVGCEGDGERSYIALVQRIVNDVHHKVHLDPQPLQPGGGDPLDLVRRAEEVITKIERTREPYDEKYLLIDRDKFGSSPERDQQMPAILRRINARIIWQDPAREALILRHLQGCAMRRPASTQISMQQLLQQWPEYEKTMSALQLATRIDLEALRQAAKVEDELRAFFTSIELL
jgi:RloB-like protein